MKLWKYWSLVISFCCFYAFASTNQPLNPQNAMFGLTPGMSLTAVKAQGVQLTPYLRYVTPSQYGLHALYGMTSYKAEALPKPFDDAALVVLSFNQNNQLKLVQVESTVFKHQTDFKQVEQRVAEIAQQLSQAYGNFNKTQQVDQALPLYQLQANNLNISITPVIRQQYGKDYDVNYVLKYAMN
ncbi:MAG: hypothetical protein KIT27_06750 [Legionellales bacterium]|nr:hypothetical protein [Legionellales bacterium]